MSIALGIDTSNYTSSVAICKDGVVVGQKKMLLEVKKGQRGLRQSDAVFLHTVNLPQIMESLFKETDICYAQIDAVGYSAYPRDVAGSYMPCFLVGESAARSLSAVGRWPVYPFSHQCGHIMAALYQSGFTSYHKNNFIAFHVSGGTTEILFVKPDSERIFCIEKIGGTLDLNAGQIVDRIGTLLNQPFPCGARLEAMALESMNSIPIGKLSVNGLFCNLSGIENQVQKRIAEGHLPNDIAAYTMEYLCRVFEALTCNVRNQYPNIPILYAGGVMSNKAFQKRLSAFENSYFAKPGFSSDNAAGTALLAEYKYRTENLNPR